ncbi:hypothetical protein BDV25DRAFT_145813 [Aspergillus avenaceus]|uniref:Uncharacterized protein n=1 Tax=Aspergillus avenaceus TaxID=36643 RepID=A0A5N6TDA4_ASPAV|nr:hypothetical protein BDV25DRAFT_145813 [Aspergillus avenaceus]
MFICPPDVSHDTRVDVDHMTSADVIRWALGQTCASLKNLSPLWASQGLQYYKRLRLWNDLVKSESLEEVVQHIQEPEARTLSELYAPWDPARFSMSSSGHDQSDAMVRELIRVSGDMNCYAGLHEEQERQVSHEAQMEQQVCRPQAVAPVQHRLYKDICQFAQHGVFPNGSSSNHIQPAFEDLHKTSAGKYDLPPDMAPHLYATSDFIRTIEQEGSNLADDFLKPVHWVLSSVDDSKILLLSQYEADKLIPEVRHSKRTTLYAYTPRTSRWMQSFEDLRFLCTGRVKEEDHVTYNRFRWLGLFAGSLYFGTFKDYEDFRHFLGLVTTHTPDCESTNDDFVDERKREEYPWPLHSPFQSNPLPFLGALCDVRSKGHGYLQTHVGFHGSHETKVIIPLLWVDRAQEISSRRTHIFVQSPSDTFHMSLNLLSSLVNRTQHPNYPKMRLAVSSTILTPLLAYNAFAGPAAYGVCQAGCSAVVMACYSAAGFTWGATLGASAPASIIACNGAYGTCQAACAATLLAPTI